MDNIFDSETYLTTGLVKWILQRIRNERQFVLDHSLKNCHAFGLHSIVLDKDEKGRLTRMFVARD